MKDNNSFGNIVVKKRRKNPERLLAQYQMQTIINIQALAKRVFSQIVQRDIQ